MRILLLILGGWCTCCIAAAQTPEVKRLLDECESLTNQQHFDAAAQSAQQAIGLSRASNDQKGTGHAFFWLASADYNARKLDAALAAARQCAEISSSSGDAEFQMRCLNLAGSSLRDQGKLDEALAVYNRSLDIGRQTGDKARSAATLRVIAGVYRMTGERERAIALGEQSVAIARELHDPKLEGWGLNLLGVLEFERQNFKRAVEDFSQALKIPSRENLLRGQLLDGLAASYCELKQFQRCIEVNQEQLQLALDGGNQQQVAFGYQHLSAAQELAGALEDAYLTKLKALATLRAGDHSIYDEWGFIQDVGQSLGRLHRDAEAVRYFQEAIALVEQLRQGLVPTEQARAASVAATKPLFDVMIDTQYGIDPAQALQSAELLRARAFLAILAESKIDLRENLTAEERDREAHIFGRISSLEKDLYRADAAAATRRQRSADLEAAENDLERLHLEIRRANPRFASVQYPKPLSLTQIQAALQPGIALIEYHLGAKRSFVWAITREHSTSAVLPAGKDIAAVSERLRKSLAAQVSGLTMRQNEDEVTRLSGQVYQMLLKPVERSLDGARSLIIVPDGVLYYVPFEALQAGGRGQFLLERFPVAYAPSATSLGPGEPQPRGAAQKMLLGIGDPVYGQSGLSPLPYTREEVMGIASLFGKNESVLYLGGRASQESLRTEAMEQYRYLHFATHGILDEAHPSRSGLALSAGAGDAGILQVDQIARLRIHADVVTLSACSTGLGELVPGEGMLGLVRSFLYAGAASVAVSLWNVNDAATATLMKEFYRNLSRSIAPEEAIRRAKISLLHEQNVLWRQPHFWAPFVLWLR